MADELYKFFVEATDQSEAGRSAESLADVLREQEGVQEVDRSKADHSTMDLGSIVTVVATSGAAIAIAQGIAAWLKARRGVSLVLDTSDASSNLKLQVRGLDPDTAERIILKTRSNE